MQGEFTPDVSIIIPCYNEEDTIESLLDAIDKQEYPLERIEIVVVDGMSTDGTRSKIEAYARLNPHLEIRVIDNLRRSIPSALNLGVAASQADFVIRLDAHSVPATDYVSRCVQTLETSGAANVGGIWIIKPRKDHSIAKGIATAAAHPLGAGDARYRIGGEAGEVETVPFGAFRRKWLERVGPFNERLLTNEDFEYNARIRQAGGVVWFDPSIRSIYYARASFTDLAKQYWRYGFWKARMLSQFPDTLRWRQALPPLFVLALITLTLLSFVFPMMRWLLSLQLGSYVLVTLFLGIQQGLKTRDLGIALTLPASLWVMHFSWGLGFLWSFIRLQFRSG